ncbi:hypothetical protein [Siansivirga zeaxanthinifaciens]|uniref:Uncharacterized protein n=1 Tax=Siansivirga zeaxanthinifaciens CC-SAMT-1 TaxID=1454006 RepID=A0A0C5W0K3_9FLAO|nr:hypothetical protein [Siansivirga zeaxanthinifaciens]AJR04811.1 hypothetical protein AW14_06535 [Siansivirga zeaxanthinifaciens CC-SAMT-1]
MKYSSTPKEILYSILSILPQVSKEFGNKEKYKSLISFLSAKDYYNDYDIPYPTMKEIEAVTGLKSYQLRKQLTEIYDKIFAFDEDFEFEFNKTTMLIHVEYHKNFGAFNCKPLKYLPRIGENISLRFLKAKIGIDFFYVQDIRHSFEENRHTIDLFLKGGLFNSYWYYRKHKAEELNEIHFQDMHKLYDFQIKEKLGL